jgi:hypothetical protein
MSPAVDEMLNLIPECQTNQRGKTWFLFPILNQGKVFRDRTSPGPDRVLVVADSTQLGQYGNYIFCGTIFHASGVDGHFELCSED